MNMGKYISFDWAAKRILRDKANFGVLEGFLTVLLGEEVKIVELLESESNQDEDTDKFNRVNIKARNSKNEIILVEIQLTHEMDFLGRVLYGVAKAITEHISLGDPYSEVKKVYSISILYFTLGRGDDYVYHGQTVLRGIHTGDVLQLDARQRKGVEMRTPTDIFPEYYLIRVNEFNQVAKTPLEEWMDYLHNAHIKDDTTTPGLRQARERLQYITMSAAEKRAYERHWDNVVRDRDSMKNARLEGEKIGEARGLARGEARGERKQAIKTATQLKRLGISTDIIIQSTGLTAEEISLL